MLKEYDYQLLRGEILKKYPSLKKFSNDVLGITQTQFSRILNNKTSFKIIYIEKIVDELDIDPKLIGSYFFNVKLQKVAK